MLRLFTGTPGSGKSFHMAYKIRKFLRSGHNVISTVNINLNYVNDFGKKQTGNFMYVNIYDLTPELLERYCLEHHEKGKEQQTLVFIDECQLIFNTRDYAKAGRRDWLVFFTSHRHYGFDFFLITQHDEMLDKQIRALIEHEVKHKKINNRLFFLPFTAFTAVETWYGNGGIKLFTEWFIYKKRIGRMYDSYMLFEDLYVKHPDLAPNLSTDEVDMATDGEPLELTREES